MICCAGGAHSPARHCRHGSSPRRTSERISAPDRALAAPFLPLRRAAMRAHAQVLLLSGSGQWAPRPASRSQKTTKQCASSARVRPLHQAGRRDEEEKGERGSSRLKRSREEGRKGGANVTVMKKEAFPNDKQRERESVVSVGQQGHLRDASYSVIPSATTCRKRFHPHVVGLARQGVTKGMVRRGREASHEDWLPR